VKGGQELWYVWTQMAMVPEMRKRRWLIKRNWSIFREWPSGNEGELSRKFELDGWFQDRRPTTVTHPGNSSDNQRGRHSTLCKLYYWPVRRSVCNIRHTLACEINQIRTSTKWLYPTHLISPWLSVYWPPGSVGTKQFKVRGLMQPVTMRSTLIRT